MGFIRGFEVSRTGGAPTSTGAKERGLRQRLQLIRVKAGAGEGENQGSKQCESDSGAPGRSVQAPVVWTTARLGLQVPVLARIQSRGRQGAGTEGVLKGTVHIR